MPEPDFHPSWYAASAGRADTFTRLEGELEADVAVIGGGLAGLNTALGLIERGADRVVLLEAKRLGYGASGRNGGFVFGGYSLDPRALVRRVGRARARRLYGWTRDAVALIRRRAHDWPIDCELTAGGVLWADWFHDHRRLLACRDWLARELDVHWTLVPQAQLAERVKSPVYGDGLLEHNAFHFHPLKYLRALAARIASQGGAIHEQTPVTALRRVAGGWRLETPAGRVRCAQAVIATGGYGPRIGRRCVMPIATYVMVTAPLGERAAEILDAPWAVYDTRFAFDYYRLLPDTRLLWGGRISIREPPLRRLRRLLRRDMLHVFPQLAGVGIDYTWSGRMSYARHQMPVLGQFASGLWYATGFGGHGMAPTTLAGEVIAEAIGGDTARLQAFSPWSAVSTYGHLGRWAAQATYWWRQGMDGIRKFS